MSRALLAGIDVGSTNIKCAIYDTAGRLVALATRATNDSPLAHARLDVDAMWARGQDVLGEAFQTAQSQAPSELRGIAVSAIGCAPVFLDHAGAAFQPEVGMGERLAAADRLARQIDPAEFTRVTGYPLDFTAGAMLFGSMTAHDAARVAEIMSVSDYLAYKLTGVIAREFSTSASFAVWDHRAGEWWTELITGFGLPVETFGRPVDSGELIGTLTDAVADRLGIPASVPVFTGGHDYLAAALATDLQPENEILNVTGTIEMMASLRSTGRDTYADSRVRSMQDAHVVPGQRSYTIESVGAGQVEWFRAGVLAPLGGQSPELGPYFDALDTMLESRQHGSELFVPQVFGRLLPSSDMTATGAFLGLGPTSGSVALLRAVVEGLCFQVKQMLDEQERVLGVASPIFKSVGGGSRSGAWGQIKADVLGLPIHLPKVKEASALGAALLAGIGAGEYRDHTEAGAVAAELGETVIEPSAERSAYYSDLYHEVYLPVVEELGSVDGRIRTLNDKHNERGRVTA